MTVTIDPKDWAKIIRKLESLNSPLAFKPPMLESMNHIHSIVRPYPAKSPGAFSRLATPGQRRAYWAKVRENPSLHGPGGYQRTNKLGDHWFKRLRMGGREGLVENTLNTYNKYVHGPRQQPFHRASGWARMEKVAEEQAPTILKIFKRHYERLIRR